MPQLEAGSSVSLNDRMPGGIWALEAMRLIKTADLLGCSIDYLLGRDVPNLGTGEAREDVPNLGTEEARENVPNLGTGWRTGTPDSEGTYIVLALYAVGCAYVPDKYQWTGDTWMYDGEAVDALDIIVDYWMPIPDDRPPEREAEPKEEDT